MNQCTGPFTDAQDCPIHRPVDRGRFDLRDEAIKAMPEAAKFERLLMEIGHEFLGAQASNLPMHSLHEGLSVIEEEVHELRLEVYKNPRKHPERNALARKEAIQVAAMALRLLNDVL